MRCHVEILFLIIQKSVFTVILMVFPQFPIFLYSDLINYSFVKLDTLEKYNLDNCQVVI